MAKLGKKSKGNTLLSIISDKAIKAKSKTTLISQLLLDNKISVDELIAVVPSQKDSDKASLIEAMEFASKTKPDLINEKAFEFVTDCLAEKSPRVKWESAKLIGNAAHLFPKQFGRAVPKLLDNTESGGAVVRWSAAFALSQIILCHTSLNKELIPAIESILKREDDNAIKKIYLQVLKKAQS